MVNKSNKKIKALFFDMDGTLVSYPNFPFNSTWDELVNILEINEKEDWINFFRDNYHNQRNYCFWFHEQIKLLKGKSFEKASSFLFPIPYSKGVLDFFSNHNKYLKGILSGGVGFVADKIVKDLNFDYNFSNSLEISNGTFTGYGNLNVDIWNKSLNLNKILKKEKIGLESILYVGDTISDINVFNKVGCSVAFNPKDDITRKSADYVITDFNELEFILKEVNK